MNTEKKANFPPEFRLLNAKQYQRVFAQSERFGNHFITILATSNSLNHPRLGMAISKKCAKRAVDRNRIKRHLRESFRHNSNNLPNVDLVAMCRPSILTLNNEILRKQIEKQWYFIRKSFAQSSSDA